jgi:anhydro-N-acetylmuramic acid kinase
MYLNGCGYFVSLSMHQNIQQLYDIAKKPSRKVLGLMSGTSLDGLDIALCELEGAGKATKLSLLNFATVSYDNAMKEEILSIFSKASVSLEKLTLMNPWIALQNAQMINQTLASWGIKASEIDLIASHGQTIYHAPKSLHPNDAFGPATLQIGDGDHLAVHTGIITISDFRQKHIAAGGEGAPLAVYGDYLLCTDTIENRLLLNIGGIANYTYLPANGRLDQVFSSDTGPGNTMMDAFMRAHYNAAYDKDGMVAKKGTINEALLKAMKANSFFNVPLPKTIGPELFNVAFIENAQLASGTTHIAKEDIMATLNRLTAETIVDAIHMHVPSSDHYTLYTSGGGMHNQLVVEHIQSLLPHITIKSSQAIGIHPDAKEAILFAVLANECVAGEPMYAGGNATKIPVTMGKISFPK